MRPEVMLYYLFEIVARKKRVSDGELAINISRCKKGWTAPMVASSSIHRGVNDQKGIIIQ